MESNSSTSAVETNVSQRDKKSIIFKFVAVLLLGQFLAILVAFTGLASKKIDIISPTWSPAFINVLVYLGLILVCFVKIMVEKLSRDINYQSFDNEELELDFTSWIILVIGGCADFYANFALTKAYQYTSMLSVMLLDAWAVPCVSIIGYILYLRLGDSWKQYLTTRLQIVGICLCIIGLVGLAVEDWRTSKFSNDSNSNIFVGDLLTLLGASIYGVSNITQEYFLRKGLRKTRLLFYYGLFGFIFGSFQSLLTERDAISGMTWSSETGLYISLFVFSMILFYFLASIMFKISSAMVFNLSLLGADFYAALISYFMFRDRFSFMYVVSMVIIITGLVLFNVYSNNKAR